MLSLECYEDENVKDLIDKVRANCNCIDSSLTNEEVWKGGLYNTIVYLSGLMRWGVEGFLATNRCFTQEISFDCCYTGFDIPYKDIKYIESVYFYIYEDGQRNSYRIGLPVYDEILGKLSISKSTSLEKDGVTYCFNDIMCTCKNTCKCEKHIFIDIKLVAGLDEVPDSLLEIICHLYSNLLLYKNCPNDCQNLENLSTNAKLLDYKVGDRQWKWDAGDVVVGQIVTDTYVSGLASVFLQYANKTPNVFIADFV